MKMKLFCLLIFSALLFPNISFCDQDKQSTLNIEPSFDILSKQRLATQFTLDSALAIKYCREADDLFVKSLVSFLDSEKSDDDCLSAFYTAKEKLIDARRIVEKWEKKGQLSEIIEEIEELKFGIDDISCACEMWTKIVEKICGGNIEDEDIKFKGSQASVKAQAGRKRLLGFSIAWSLRIHHGENKPRSHHIQLTKTQYGSIKRYINTILSDELNSFEETKDRDNLSTYVFCARMFDYAVTKELEKGIEEEDIENTRHIEDPESSELIKENDETWLISKFKLKSGCLIHVRTHFKKSDISYDKQEILIKGKHDHYDKNSEPKIITSPEGEKFFIFSYEPYDTICCVISFNDKENKHQCRLMISKE